MNSDIWLSLFCKNASLLDLVAFFNKSTVTVNCYEMALKFNLKLQFRSRLSHKGEIFLGTGVAFLFSEKKCLFSKSMIHHSTFFLEFQWPSWGAKPQTIEFFDERTLNNSNAIMLALFSFWLYNFFALCDRNPNSSSTCHFSKCCKN